MPQRNPSTPVKEAPVRVESVARLRWVPIPQMKVSIVAQRELKPYRVDHLAAHFDPDMVGHPTVSWRDGWFYIVDGQHRIEALKAVGWGDQQVQCWTYEGLSEEEEASIFDRLNDTLTVDTFDRFRIRIRAGRDIESDIDRIVRANGLCLSREEVDGRIMAVGTLRRVYTRSDPKTLARTLRIIRDAYGDAGLGAPVIDGIAHLCQRYNGQIDDATVVSRLSAVHGGVSGLLNSAAIIRRKTGGTVGHSVAAAAVDVLNRGRGGKKLPDWFKGA